MIYNQFTNFICNVKNEPSTRLGEYKESIEKYYKEYRTLQKTGKYDRIL